MRAVSYTSPLLAACLLFAGSPGHAADTTEDLVPLTGRSPSGPAYNRVAVSYRLGFNLSVTFEDVGGFPALSLAKPAPSGGVYNYDDGYVLPDISGSAVDTWYWGYAAGADLNGVSLNRSWAEPTESTSTDPRQGVEIDYWRMLGLVGGGHWGLAGAFNFTSMEHRKRGSMSAPALQQTDRYAAPTPPPPAAPYYGTFEGPVPGGPARPLLLLTPTSSTVASLPGGASGTVEHRYEAQLFGFRLGPYVELPLSRRLALDLSGGLAAALVNSDYTFAETMTIAQLGTLNSQGSTSDSEFVVGAFAAMELWLALSRDWSAFAGAQYQYLGSSTTSSEGRNVTLDLGKSVFVTVGLGYAF